MFARALIAGQAGGGDAQDNARDWSKDILIIVAIGLIANLLIIAIPGFYSHDELDWQNRIAQPSILVTDVYGIAGLKHAMDLNGYFGGAPRLPFVVPTSQQRAEIEEAFKDLKG